MVVTGGVDVVVSSLDGGVEVVVGSVVFVVSVEVGALVSVGAVSLVVGLTGCPPSPPPESRCGSTMLSKVVLEPPESG